MSTVSAILVWPGERGWGKSAMASLVGSVMWWLATGSIPSSSPARDSRSSSTWKVICKVTQLPHVNALLLVRLVTFTVAQQPHVNCLALLLVRLVTVIVAQQPHVNCLALLLVTLVTFIVTQQPHVNCLALLLITLVTFIVAQQPHVNCLALLLVRLIIFIVAQQPHVNCFALLLVTFIVTQQPHVNCLALLLVRLVTFIVDCHAVSDSGLGGERGVGGTKIRSQEGVREEGDYNYPKLRCQLSPVTITKMILD